jgi:hypothetical protein
MIERTSWRAAVTAVLLALALAGSSSAQAQSLQLKWTQLPTEADMAAAFPAKATADHVGGRAIVGCAVTADGGLADCTVVSEDPAGYGFGPAALGLTPLIRLDRSTGRPEVGERLNLPIRFMAPGVDAPPTVRQVKFVGHADSYADLGPVGPYYPERAVEARHNGLAVIACIAAEQGVLTDCKLDSETPRNEDFGPAALMMAKRKWIVAAPRADGAPEVGAVELFRVPFVMRGR